MRNADNDLWVVTSYFNPVGFRTRRENYRAFRENLRAPLLTIELAYGTGFELGPGDADRLLQLRSDQVLWQKERLINLAVEALPEHCRKVAWVDCDVIFARDDWARAASAALDEAAVIQPYRTIHDLERGADPNAPGQAPVVMRRVSMASRYVDGTLNDSTVTPSMLGQHSPGHAWCARREVLEAAGLYDGMIVGGGDLGIGLAAIGRHEAFVCAYAMGPAHAEHYRRWAVRFHEAVQGRLGVLDGDIYHLWHGSLEDRGYETRYDRLRELDFDPSADVALDENGCWRWTTGKPALRHHVRDWFAARREDGREAERAAV
jgi:hypothetical protein